MLTFDEPAHAYFWNGKRVPNVTTLLDLLTDFNAVPPAVLENARQRGTMVHLICELYDLGDLDESAIPNELCGYLEAYLKFREAHRCRWDGIEERVYHPLLGYAGTLDRRGLVDDRPSILDIKTSADIYASVGPQTVAYLEACRASDVIPKKSPVERLCLRLGKDGAYALDGFTKTSEKPHWAAFTACLTIHNFKRNHNGNT